MGFFEEAIVKAKEVYDVAAKKTSEVVSVQKLKLKATQVNSQLSKDFETLGRLYYEKVKESGENIEYVELFDSIDSKFDELEQIEDEINEQKKTKTCSNCGAKNSETAAFCNNCGTQL
ncbi:MAG: zinc ribbon domain-containing protein [Clostridia bacterium]|nr:zinc ribbon domain-containing protein [Clostridia bacterium]